MGEETGITWTDHTLVPWEGCRKISPACDGCYAEARNRRFHQGRHWGGTERRRTAPATRNAPLRWDRKAHEAGVRRTVFCNSQGDVFDKDVPAEWRDELWGLIDQTPSLVWLLLSKRIGNAAAMVPPQWQRRGWPDNVMPMATVVTQEEAVRDVPKLLALPARAWGISVEPMLGPIRLQRRWLQLGRRLWVVCGGESEQPPHRARPLHPRDPRWLRDQCRIYGVPFHFKQWGEWLPGEVYADGDQLGLVCHQDGSTGGHKGRLDHWWSGDASGGIISTKVGVKAAGRLLDGVLHDAPCPLLEMAA